MHVERGSRWSARPSYQPRPNKQEKENRLRVMLPVIRTVRVREKNVTGVTQTIKGRRRVARSFLKLRLVLSPAALAT
jgi:hypothetical protein